MASLSARLTRSRAAERIRKAAVILFRKRGYHGTSLRDLGRAAHLQAGSLYYYYPSKQEILFEVLDGAMNEMLDGVSRATCGLSDPADRLRASVRFHVTFHASRRDEAFLSRSELRSLEPTNLRKMLTKRDQYEAVFREAVEAGMREGIFRVSDVPLTAMAVLTMCSGVADWFSPRGRLGAEAVAERYAEMALRLVSSR